MKRYDQRKTTELRSKLFKSERWISDVVLNIIHVLIEKEPVLETPTKLVDVVCPLFLERLVDREPKTQSHNIATMKRYFSETRMLLLPVFAMEHWSLLVYVKELKTWYYCDSMGEMHGERINYIMARLHLLGVYDGLNQEEKRISFHPILKKQGGQVECGCYLAMYAMAFIFNIKKFPLTPIDPDLFLSRLQSELSHITEDKRQEFLRCLDNELLFISENHHQ